MHNGNSFFVMPIFFNNIYFIVIDCFNISDLKIKLKK